MTARWLTPDDARVTRQIDDSAPWWGIVIFPIVMGCILLVIVPILAWIAVNDWWHGDEGA